MKTVLLFISILFINISYGQLEYSNWNVGNKVWLKFPGPVYLNNSQLNTVEGCASISDPITGSLLFYTNGVNVWNKLHLQMLNGFGLLGGQSSTQSAIILKQPGNTNLYYIFTVGDLSGASGSTFSYSIVDINLNAGLGDVTIKNTLIYTPTSEKLTATKHCNGIDWWIMTHDQGNNTFRAVLLTSLGVSTSTWSNVGTTITSVGGGSIGSMKFNQQGTKLAVAYYSLNKTCIYNFNNSTGVVSVEVNLPTSNGPYGLEFSPNGNYLYVSYNSAGFIHQIRLCNNIITAVNVGSSGTFVGSLQLQNDGRIYCSRSTVGGSTLGIIYDPDLLSPNYVASVSNTPFVGQNFIFGLSQCFFDNSTFTYSYTPTISVNCLTATFTIPNLCNMQQVNSVLWNFGDGNTTNIYTPTHTYVTANNYFGTLTINFTCYSITLPFTLSTSVTGLNNLNSN